MKLHPNIVRIDAYELHCARCDTPWVNDEHGSALYCRDKGYPILYAEEAQGQDGWERIEIKGDDIWVCGDCWTWSDDGEEIVIKAGEPS